MCSSECKCDISLLIVIVLFSLIILGIGQIVLDYNNGSFVYTLDDAYIHMAMAKNLAVHGVWGITKQGFSSATSSPTWTIILGITYKILGVGLTTPLLLNIVLSIILLACLSIIFRTYAFNQRYQFLSLTAIMLAIPLPLLVFHGMEHVLHIILTVILVYSCISHMSGSKKEYLILASGSLFLITRYEGVFLLIVLAAVLLFRNERALSVKLLAVSFIPVMLYGLISLNQDYYPVPNALLLKNSQITGIGPLSDPVAFITSIPKRILAIPLLPVLMLSSILFTSYQGKKNGFQSESSAYGIIFIATGILHALFVPFSISFRYEGYLIALGMLTCLIQSKGIVEKYIKDLYIWIILWIFILAVVSVRFLLIYMIPLTSHNTYEQHIQMAGFIKEHYSGQAIALNDIGAVNYYADFKCVDLFGLADIDVAQSRMAGTYDTQSIERIADERDVKIAIVYSGWFDDFGGLPDKWVNVGNWTIKGNEFSKMNTLSFYAVEESEIQVLKEKLLKFSNKLPKSINQEGLYIGD